MLPHQKPVWHQLNLRPGTICQPQKPGNGRRQSLDRTTHHISVGVHWAGGRTPGADSFPPFADLATFRMVVLADELLESFFNADLAGSFRLEPTPDNYHTTHKQPDSLVGGLMNLVLTNENKSRFNKFADGIGSALGRHTEWRMPSIGKPEAAQQAEVKARESLLSPAQKEQQRVRSPTTMSTASMESTATTERQVREDQDILRAAQEAVMHRPNFAIDAIGDSDGEDDGAEDDEGVMDEVEAFLKANDTDEKGIEGKEKELANG